MGEGYAVVETAVDSGNRLQFQSRSQALPHSWSTSVPSGRPGGDKGHGEALGIGEAFVGPTLYRQLVKEREMAADGQGSYSGKVAFVTGAGTGIGRAAALAFAREGASVVVADVSEQDNRETARMIEESGGPALAVGCDVTRTEDVKAALDKTVDARSGVSTSSSTTPESNRRRRPPRRSLRRSGTGS